ncbi:hypothetical protein M422DRAFT_40766 [Sphaerobolus stellatus SS14]|nr:hypothetical protein M422DRAFT_40766 [Sphaerobolus stellatus SS14]
METIYDDDREDIFFSDQSFELYESGLDTEPVIYRVESDSEDSETSYGSSESGSLSGDESAGIYGGKANPTRYYSFEDTSTSETEDGYVEEEDEDEEDEEDDVLGLGYYLRLDSESDSLSSQTAYDSNPDDSNTADEADDEVE